MDWHYSVQVRFAGVHLDGDRNHLNELGGAFADNVAAQHSIRIRVDNQFHQRTIVAPGQGGLHRTKFSFVDIDGVFGARFTFGKPDAANLGIGEHRGRNRFVVDRPGLAAKLGIGEGVSVLDRDGRQIDAICNIANRKDVGDVGAGISINRDPTMVGERHASLFKAEPGDIGPATNRE